MEIKRKAKFRTAFLGGLPALGADKVLAGWVEKNQDKAFLSKLDSITKKGQTALDALQEVLSIMHRDSKGYPVFEGYMLRRCLLNTGKMLFNAMKDKTHPKKTALENGILDVSPLMVSLYNGKLITKPDGVMTTTISTKGKSFFKAYEFVNPETTFEVTMYFDDDLLSEGNINKLLDKAGLVGLGAWRERFGKFEWL